MNPILIIDKTLSDRYYVQSVKDKLKKWFDNVDVYILNNGCACDSDTHILLKILITDEDRCFVILDEKVARLYPEIIKKQKSVVMFKRETIKTHEVSEHSYSESIAILHSGTIDYIDLDFKEIENDKFFDILGISNYIATEKYYEDAKTYIKEVSRLYPCLFLSKSCHHGCNDMKSLKLRFQYRNKWIIVPSVSNDGVSFDYNEKDAEFIDSAIHSHNDERLKFNKTQIYFKPI